MNDNVEKPSHPPKDPIDRRHTQPTLRGEELPEPLTLNAALLLCTELASAYPLHDHWHRENKQTQINEAVALVRQHMEHLTPPPRTKHIVFCEGEIDCVTMQQAFTDLEMHDWLAVVPFFTTHQWNRIQQALNPVVKRRFFQVVDVEHGSIFMNMMVSIPEDWSGIPKEGEQPTLKQIIARRATCAFYELPFDAELNTAQQNVARLARVTELQIPDIS